MKRMIDEKQLQFVKDVKVGGVSVVSNGVATISSGAHTEMYSIDAIGAANFTDTVSLYALGNMYTHKCSFVVRGVEFIITVQSTSNVPFSYLQQVLDWLTSGTYTVAGIKAGNKEGIIFKTIQTSEYNYDLHAIV